MRVCEENIMFANTGNTIGISDVFTNLTKTWTNNKVKAHRCNNFSFSGRVKPSY